jgi:2-hydroxychromene-2-carboxylate isomerase
VTAARAAFYYDLNSPYAWLAAERVEQLAPSRVEWVPVLLGAIFKARGRGSWAETEERAAGIAEVERRARARGLPPPRWPNPWPNDGLRAMRAAVYAHAQGSGERFAREAFRISFLEGRLLSEEASLRLALERAGLDPELGLAATGDPQLKARLRRNTDDALQAGVVGVPTVLLGDEVFWGDDRLEEAFGASTAERALDRAGRGARSGDSRSSPRRASG